MKRFLGITISIAGMILMIFVINLLMYSFVPSYHEALETAVEGNSDIPVVVVDEAGNVIIEDKFLKAEKTDTKIDIEGSLEEVVPLSSTIADGDMSFVKEADSDADAEKYLKEDDSEDAKLHKQIVDKEYHEDCGTGKGYWVIRYSDGSTSVE